MKNNVIKEESLQEYENRVKSLHGIIVYAYYDYHYLMQIGERRKGYNLDCIFNIALNPAMEFLNSIIYSLQKEFILFVWGLKDGDKESNSIVQLKAFLHTCVIDFESKKKI